MDQYVLYTKREIEESDYAAYSGSILNIEKSKVSKFVSICYLRETGIKH